MLRNAVDFLSMSMISYDFLSGFTNPFRVIRVSGVPDKGRGLATLIHIPLGCIVLGAILGHQPPTDCQPWVACWPAARAPARPLGVTQRGPLVGVEGTKVLGPRVVQCTATLPEAGGQVGEVPVAVSWEWLPGAPCGGVCCCEGRPACEFVGLHDSSDSVRSGGVQLLPGFPPKKKI